MRYFNILILFNLIIPLFTQIFEPIGIIYNIFVLVVAMFEILKNKNHKWKYFMLFLLLYYFIALIFTNNIYTTLNDIFRIIYLMVFILITLDDNFKKDFIMLNTKYYKKIIIIITIIILYLLVGIFNSNFYMAGGPYESAAYISSFRSPHTLAYYLMFLSMYLLVLNKIKFNKYSFILIICNFFLILMTGARAAILLLLAIIYYYVYTFMFKKNKKIKFLIFITVTFVCMVTILNLNPNLLEKIPALSKIFMRTSNSNKSFLSNREDFWLIILNIFSEFEMSYKLIGAGPEYVYNSIGIWAHNDYLNILLGYGIIGILIYSTYLYVFFKNNYNKNQKYRFVIFGLAILLTAFFNGVYNQTIFSVTLYLISLLFFEFTITK